MSNDLTLPADELIISLVESDNQIELNNSAITLSEPSVLEGESRNTQLTISAKPNLGYKGNKTVSYNRLELSDFLTINNNVFTVEEDATSQDVLDLFNDRYNISLDLDVDVTAPNPSPTTSPTNYTLTALSTSKKVIGSVTIQIAMEEPVPEPLVGISGQIETTLDDLIHASSVMFSGELWIVGGSANYNMASPYPYIRRHRLTNGNSIAAFSLPIGIASTCTVIHDNKLYIVGGRRQDGTMSSEVYEVTTSRVITSKALLPNGRHGLVGVVVGDYGYFVGGYSESGHSNQANNNLFRYDFINNTWTTLSSSPTAGRHLAMWHYQGKLYTLPVHTPNSWLVGIYDIATDTWSTQSLGTMGSFGISVSNSNAARFGNHVYVNSRSLGFGSSFKIDVRDLSVSTFPITPEIYSVNAGICAGLDRLYVVGGYNTAKRISVIT